MSSSNLASLILDHLGVPTHTAGLVSARSFRSITVSRHHVREQEWAWSPPSDTSRRSCVVLFADTDAVVRADGAEAADSDTRAPIGLFLPGDGERTLGWVSERDVLAVWIPERLLAEFLEDESPAATVLHATPLTIGFRTFAHAVAQHRDEGSSMSQYAIERLLAEMTFGSLLEQHSVETSQRPSSLIERARSIMLLHREDSGFSTRQLAAELHISPRQLQRAFARAGLTPGDMLRRMRVELAESMLRNPIYSGLTVEEVSRYAGFTSALQLRRALQAEGTPPPTMLRRESMAPPA